MSKVIWIIAAVLAGCLMGIPAGYIIPTVYEANFVPTPTVTPTPSTIFVPVDITLEELRMKETVTVHDIASQYLRTEEQIMSEGLRPAPAKTKRIKVNLAIKGKRLQTFKGTVKNIGSLRDDVSGCVIAISGDDYPAFNCVTSISGSLCTELGINSKVLMNGKIEDVIFNEGGYISLQLADTGLSVR